MFEVPRFVALCMAAVGHRPDSRSALLTPARTDSEILVIIRHVPMGSPGPLKPEHLTLEGGPLFFL